MARLAMLATMILILGATAVSGCTGKTTATSSAPATTARPAGTTTTPLTPATTSLASTSTSGRSSPTASGPTTTAGMPWNEVVRRFTKIVTEWNLPGTLPYSLLPDDEVAWLLGNDAPVHPTNVAGFKFANGDLVVLFYASMLLGRLSDVSDIRKVMSDAEKALQKVAESRYQVPGKSVQASVRQLTFGFVVVTGQYRDELWGLANAAYV
jgi:hypothetical protein